MSYSFQARGADLAAALADAASKFDGVVASQPTHADDRQAALDCAFAFGSMLAPDPTQDVVISLSGSLGWQGDVKYTSAGVNCSVWRAPRS